MDEETTPIEETTEETTPIEETDVSEPVVPSEPLRVDPIVAANAPVPVITTIYDADKNHDSVKFHLSDFATKSREFSNTEHGESWKDIAKEFFTTNANKVTSVEYS